MASPSEIVKSLSSERFAAILAASPKRFREELFRRAGVRVKGNDFSLAGSSKNQRTQRLLETLKSGAQADLGDDVLEELIRNYLYTRRSMLADALDHFQVPHDNGLTDADLAFINDLSAERSAGLRQLLEAKYEQADVELYFSFMGIPSS